MSEGSAASAGAQSARDPGAERARVAVVFHSVTGTTAQLAAAVAAGAAESAARAELIKIEDRAIHHGRFVDEPLLARLDAADALVFGTPTFMGGPSAPFKAFADATSPRWDDRRWVGKLAAGFTVGGSLNGDMGLVLTWLWTLACQHGMLWVGMDLNGAVDAHGPNRLGVQQGAAAQTLGPELQPRDLATARHLGRRVAAVAQQMARGRLQRR